MRLVVMLLGAAVLAMGLRTDAAAGDDPHDQAIAAIRKLGGEVVVDSKGTDSPVAITLTGSADPDKCLPYLKDVRNLHKCDL
ncbi:MAG: hypothetical protein L0211_00145 [Planctomycetaceae bacterium]|nr:hypothetical protein [Planctomycetaceae bacterium]